jgi:hypothetical protein
VGFLDPDTGDWRSIGDARRRNKERQAEEQGAKPPLPAETPQPPAETDPGPVLPQTPLVDEFFVEDIGRQHLPDEAAYLEYRRLKSEFYFRDRVIEVIERSGEDLDDFAQLVSDLADDVAAKEQELNTKKVPDVHPPADDDHWGWGPLPGVRADQVCASAFDVNDLALRGIEAVTYRRYYRPLIFTDAFVRAPDDAWLFGQRLDYQQEWRHDGFTLGDLSSSMSLLPGEELTVEVSSWQRTKSEISQESDDTTRQQLENEQRSTDERSCTRETAAQNGWSVSASASVGTPVWSASVNASATGSSSERAEQSNRELREATTNATTEVSARRAIKLTQTSEAGSESTTTRRIRNPNQSQTVTYNFFQVIKLYDVQLRVVGDSPVLLLPGIFPRFYGPLDVRRGEVQNVLPTEVQIPFHLIEGWRSPAVFLTQYFDVDRDLSREISGWALRVRFDTTTSPQAAVLTLAEALVVATRFLLGDNPEDRVAQLAELVKQYVQGIRTLRENSAAGYGPGKGRQEQLNTSGIYVDSLRGRCVAWEDFATAERYVDVITQAEEATRLRIATALDDLERQRREKLLEDNNLDPFEEPVEEPVPQ